MVPACDSSRRNLAHLLKAIEKTLILNCRYRKATSARWIRTPAVKHGRPIPETTSLLIEFIERFGKGDVPHIGKAITAANRHEVRACIDARISSRGSETESDPGVVGGITNDKDSVNLAIPRNLESSRDHR